MKMEEIAHQIVQRSQLKGTFRLRSGQMSEEYFDKYRFESDPVLLCAIAEKSKGLVPDGTEILAGLELGGIPIATVLSQLTGLPEAFIRKTAKEYGTCKFAEGADVGGRRVLIVEDVVTSGGQIVESAQAIRAIGGIVEYAFCVIDRESGGRERLAVEGIELLSLFCKSELPVVREAH